MKKQTKKTKRAEIIAISLSLAILAIGGYMIYAQQTRSWPYKSWFEPTMHPDNSRPYNESLNSPSNTPPMPTTVSARKDGDTIYASATFKVLAVGNCELELSKPGKESIFIESQIYEISTNTYFCGFSLSGMPDSGWTATITHIHNGQKSVPVSKKIE